MAIRFEVFSFMRSEGSVLITLHFKLILLVKILARSQTLAIGL